MELLLFFVAVASSVVAQYKLHQMQQLLDQSIFLD